MSTEASSSSKRVRTPPRPPRPLDSFPLPPQPVILGSKTRQAFRENTSISKTTTRSFILNQQLESRVSIDGLARKIDSAGQGGNFGIGKGKHRSNKRRSSQTVPIIPPKSDSTHSLASTNSTTSSTFGLSSPFPRPQTFKPSHQHPHSEILQPGRSYDKENIASTSAIPLDSSPSTTHIRLRNVPSLEGFPYRSSSALAFANQSHHDHHHHQYEKKVEEREEEEGEDVDAEGSTDEDVDLDLSFDLHPTTGNSTSSLLEYAQEVPEDNWPGGGGGVRAPTRRGDSFSSDEFERDLAVDAEGKYSTLSEREVVRSDSGQMLGTKQKMKSVLGLRQAYFEGEKVLAEEGKKFNALIDREVDQKIHQKKYPGNGTARTEWVRKTSVDPTLNLVSIARRSDNPTYHHSLAKGFAYNPTDPLNIPLPDSPLTTPSTPLELAKKSKTFPLPLKLVEKRKSMNPLASPAWSISSFFASAQVKGPTSEAVTADVLADYVPSKRASQDLRLSYEFEETHRASWAGELTKSALDLLSGRRSRPGTPHNIRIVSTPSEEDSPMFGGSTPSDFHISSDEARTPKDTSLYIYNDLEEEEENEEPHRYYSYSEQPVEVDLGRPRSQLRKDALAGLGLDFSGDDGHRPVAHFASRPPSFQRPQIPSLSLSPPPLSDVEDEDDEGDDLNSSLQSSQSDIESLNTPSRRASRILASPSTLSIDSGSSSPCSPDYLISAARPHFGTGLRGFYPSTPLEPRHIEVDSPLPSVKSPITTSRFSFIPVSLNLVGSNHQNRQLPISNYNSPLIKQLSSPIALLSPPALRKIHRSSFVNSISSSLSNLPRTSLDEMLPAKFFFLAGFIFGPWCWILGGWWLRNQDGELWKTRGGRCREENCCGGSMKKSHHSSRIQHGVENNLKWGGVDQFVFLNRVAGVGSGVVVLGLVIGAVFVAVTGVA